MRLPLIRPAVLALLASGGGRTLVHAEADPAKLPTAVPRARKGKANPTLNNATACPIAGSGAADSMASAAVDGSGRSPVPIKRGQKVGYQGYALTIPRARKEIVVTANFDNGSTLATALIRRAAAIFRRPPLGTSMD